MLAKLIHQAPSGKLYAWTLSKQTRVAFARPGDPTSRYERSYFELQVYEVGTDRLLNFGFIDISAPNEVHLAIRHPDIVTAKLAEVVHQIEHPIVPSHVRS